MRTQVGIVGAGRAGLMLGQLLTRAGTDALAASNKLQTVLAENYVGQVS